MIYIIFLYFWDLILYIFKSIYQILFFLIYNRQNEHNLNRSKSHLTKSNFSFFSPFTSLSPHPLTHPLSNPFFSSVPSTVGWIKINLYISHFWNSAEPPLIHRCILLHAYCNCIGLVYFVCISQSNVLASSKVSQRAPIQSVLDWPAWCNYWRLPNFFP